MARKIDPELQAQGRNILRLMDEEAEAVQRKRMWLGIAYLAALVAVIVAYAVVIVFAPMWLKVIVTLFIIWRVMVLVWRKRQATL